MVAAASRIAAAVDVAVTADLEGGYGLPAPELVERMREAGVVGLNFEDTDHATGGESLVDPETQAARVAELREAARAAGHDIVINARMDPYLAGLEGPLDDSLHRARLHLDAGAGSALPARVEDDAAIERHT